MVACSGYVYVRQLFQDLFSESISAQFLSQPNFNHVAKYHIGYKYADEPDLV